MNKKHAREALDSYKKFLIRMDRVAEFLKVAEVSTKLHFISSTCSIIIIGKTKIVLIAFTL